MEIRNDVKVIQVDYTCPHCGGKMRPTGEVLTSNPPIYPHKCEDCKYEKQFKKTYPYLDYEEI